MTDWKKILADKKARLEELEVIVENKEHMDTVEKKDNPFLDEDTDDIWAEKCETCEEYLNENEFVYENLFVGAQYFCEESCVLRNLRNEISTLKLTMPDVEELANAGE
jgi:hypothetical protein